MCVCMYKYMYVSHSIVVLYKEENIRAKILSS